MVKIVKIKTWEEMEEEFTYYAGDGLWVNGMHFNKEMEKELPQDRIIEINYYPQYDLWLWAVGTTDYAITEGMIKEEITEDKEVIVPNPTKQPKGVIETFVDKMTSDKEVKEETKDKKMSKKASIEIKDFKITEDEVQITISKEEFAKELSLYGKIVEDINQETILGYLRITSFNYIDKGFTVIKLNGEVLTIKEFL